MSADGGHLEWRLGSHDIIFKNWPPKDLSCHVCLKLTYWFQRRKLLNIFSIGSYVKTKSSHGGHLEFPIGKRFTSLVQDHPMIIPAKSQFNKPTWWFLTRRLKKIQPMRTHYGHWQPCWISNQHQKHKSGRGPSNEHFWQVWLKSVQRFQRRRVKCEKLKDGRRTLTHDKSSHGLWPGELKMNSLFLSWSKRNILLLGKALMVKSLIIHILTFVVSSCVIPEKYKKR
jgi:hypothetical protein